MCLVRYLMFIKAMFLVLVLLVPPALSADYYMASNGSDSADGSIGSPWRSFRHAAGTMSPGDTVYLRGGTWTNPGDMWLQYSFGHSGSAAGGYKTFVNYPGETPIFTGSGRFIIYGCSYLIFDGITFQAGIHMTWYTDEATPSNNIIRNCTFTGQYSVGAGALNITGTDTLVENNTLTLTKSGDNNDHGIYLKAADFAHPGGATTSGIVIRGNTVSGVSGYGIHLYDQDKTDGATRYFLNILVERNKVTNATNGGIIIAAEQNTYQDGIVIRNNVISGVTFFGTGTYIGLMGAATFTNIEIYNNTIYDWQDYGIFIENATGVIIKNNILDDSAGGTTQIRNTGTSVTASYNLYPDGSANNSGVTDSNPVYGDPDFTNAAGGDFSIDADSAAHDAGTTIASVTDDYIGTSRPQGAAYDIGAYEYGSGGSPTPSNITGLTVVGGSFPR